MDACRSIRAIGCIMVAAAGLPVLATLVDGDPGLLASLAAAMLGASFASYLARETRLASIYYVIAGLALVVGFLGASTTGLIAALALAYSASILAVLSTGRVSAGLASLSLALPGVYVHGSGAWPGLYSVIVIAASGLAAYELSSRGHSLMILTVAPLASIVDPLMAVAASATSLMLGFAASGLIERSGCPFTTDSGMTFVGVTLSVVAAVLGLLYGFEEGNPAFIMWIMGFIFLEAGVLVPVGAFRTQTSSGA